MIEDQDVGEAVAGSARRVAARLIQFGPMSRVELARRLGLSRASVTRLTRPLIEAGLLVEGRHEQQSTTGRPAQLIDVVGQMHYFVGVNLTGDDVCAVVTDLRANGLTHETATFGGREPSDVVAVVRSLIERLADAVPRVLGVGVSLGGAVSDRRTVVRAHFLGWHDEVALGDAVEAATDLPVVVDNDLLSVTRAEQWFGAGRSTDHFAVLTIGAGVGFGLVVHGRIVTSPDAGFGLVGALPLDPLGPLCAAGHRGCGTAMLTIGSIRRQVAQALGRTVAWNDVLQLARDGQPAVSAIVEASGRALGRLIAAIANIAMPDVIVLAGEGMGLADVAATAVSDGLYTARAANAAPVDLVVRRHDFAWWARGAAVAAIEDYLEHRLTANPTHPPTARARRPRAPASTAEPRRRHHSRRSSQ